MQTLIELLHNKYRSLSTGKPASYIPELAKANAQDFAIVITTVNGEQFCAGDFDKQFTLQSTSKPFIYGMALAEYGREEVISKVGVEPTGEAFNSIVELEKRTHRPYNPMINSGAIAISSLIKGNNLKNRESNMMSMFEAFAGHQLEISNDVFESEKLTAHRNRSIAHLLRHFDVIDEKIDETLDLYFKQCSILVDTKDLSMMAATLANSGVNPNTKKSAIPSKYVGDVLSLMFTCGMYDSSGEWAYSIGVPAKSGVSGAIFGVVPGEFGIAVYSPPIDEKGHSTRGVEVFKEFSHECNLSIFRKTII
ncbi:MAG: glutaminase A [Bdellovibrionales bacterium CG12_big_fil_rev_8_21_14_0_65_38_15]|nr:MAG: glutaminase A [Bdellovibrionales bacterium CG22_combo_CG10-13_8_21_14_all_38_13]PIQ54172.1 MAG: glutaminase A [Bdellovibrionales bacterium CG12_big_fil_rev_8_21_14_0_65_38_15]PIR29230.1 MAG: glutaminase A [Bdellovibrionales bacterium CG11_big_fil_rev_8_21_14_0_20_38_13]